MIQAVDALAALAQETRLKIYRLLVETDSPFLAPPGAPRSRNEPEWVRVTAAWVAEARETEAAELGPQLVAAYDRTFPRSRPRP